MFEEIILRGEKKIFDLANGYPQPSLAMVLPLLNMKCLFNSFNTPKWYLIQHPTNKSCTPGL